MAASTPTEDRELLRQLAKGSQSAFAVLYERFQGPIYRFAWHMSGKREVAEEVTQEVFLRLIASPKKYDPAKGSLGGYLFGIARNVVRSHVEQSYLDVPIIDEMLELDELGLADDTDVLAQFDHREMLDRLRKSVLALPEPYRAVVVLCDMEEMSYDEAGAILLSPPGTVASRLHRARAMLKGRMREMGCMR